MMEKMKNGWRKIASIHKFKKTEVKKIEVLFSPLLGLAAHGLSLTSANHFSFSTTKNADPG